MADRRPTGPPGPAGERWVGNLAAYEKDRLGFLLRTRDEFGGLVAFDRRTAIVHDPELVAQVLKDRDGRFEISENFLQQRLSSAAVDDIFRTRSLLNPGLRPSAVEGVAAQVGELVRHRFAARVAAGDEFDPLPALEEVISSAVAAHFFGTGGRDLPGPTGDLLDALAGVIGNPWALPAAFPTPTRRRIHRRHLVLRNRVVDLLRVREAAPALHDDLATQILAGRPAGEPLTRVADLLIGSLLAAQRVPAAGASWLLMLVADRAEWQERAAEDERSARAVVAEALRLYPPTWIIMRAATRPVELGGYRFGAGHQFLISPYVLHRDPRVFPDPEKFRPERWLGPDRAVPSGYLPFGLGRHRCPGVNLATIALTAVLRTLVGLGQVELASAKVTADARTTLLPRGLRVCIRPQTLVSRVAG